MKFNFGPAFVERTENEDGAIIIRIKDETADIQYAIAFGEVWLYHPSKDYAYIKSSMDELIFAVDEDIGGERNSAKFFKKLAERELASYDSNMALVQQNELLARQIARQNEILSGILKNLKGI